MSFLVLIALEKKKKVYRFKHRALNYVPKLHKEIWLQTEREICKYCREMGGESDVYTGESNKFFTDFPKIHQNGEFDIPIMYSILKPKGSLSVCKIPLEYIGDAGMSCKYDLDGVKKNDKCEMRIKHVSGRNMEKFSDIMLSNIKYKKIGNKDGLKEHYIKWKDIKKEQTIERFYDLKYYILDELKRQKKIEEKRERRREIQENERRRKEKIRMEIQEKQREREEKVKKGIELLEKMKKTKHMKLDVIPKKKETAAYPKENIWKPVYRKKIHEDK